MARYIYCLLIGIFTTSALLGIQFWPTWTGFLVVLGTVLTLLGLILWLVGKNQGADWLSALSIIATVLAGVVVMSVNEVRVLRALLPFGVGFAATMVAFWFFFRPALLPHVHKRFRRAFTFFMAFVVYALFVATFAGLLFFPLPYTWVLVNLFASLIAAGASILVWRQYESLAADKIWLWLGVGALCWFELLTIFQQLPIGFLISAFLLAWLWYVYTLFLRFHFSSLGIVWKKQIGFMIANTILFIIILFSSRFI